MALPDPDDLAERHPFSLSAAAHGDRLRITVKALGPGSRLVQSFGPAPWYSPKAPPGR